MAAPESLQTIAEIGIAIAGFTGLVVALRRKPGPLTGIEKYRLQILLALALGAMFLSFLPELLEDLGVRADRVWVLASAAVAAYSVGFLTFWIYRSRRVARLAPELFNWFAFSRMICGHCIVLLILLAVVFSWVADRGAGAFVVALIWYLVHASQQFTRMLFIQPASPERQPPSDA